MRLLVARQEIEAAGAPRQPEGCKQLAIEAMVCNRSVWLFLVFWVTLVCGEANLCSVAIAVWLITGNPAVSHSSEGYLAQTRSYQTRIAVYEGIDRSVGDAALSAYAALYGKVQRKLFAVVAAGESAVSKKSEYIEKHGIPARMFNAVRITLDGKVSAVRESQLLQLDSLRRRVSRAAKQVLEAEQGCQWRQVHGKRRRLANLKFRLAGGSRPCGWPGACASKKLWRKQHHLEQNWYASREEWQLFASNEFFVLGSRDETAGCQLCVAAVNDGTRRYADAAVADADSHGTASTWWFQTCGLPTDTRRCGGAGEQHRVRSVPTGAW